MFQNKHYIIRVYYVCIHPRSVGFFPVFVVSNTFLKFYVHACSRTVLCDFRMTFFSNSNVFFIFLSVCRLFKRRNSCRSDYHHILPYSAWRNMSYPRMIMYSQQQQQQQQCVCTTTYRFSSRTTCKFPYNSESVWRINGMSKKNFVKWTGKNVMFAFSRHKFLSRAHCTTV